MRNYEDKEDWNLINKGRILQKTIEIERKLEVFLSSFFCDNKNKEMLLSELLFQNERVTFDFKREITTVILKKYYKDFLAENPEMLSNLINIAPHRNRFAHLESVEGDSLKELLESKETIIDAMEPNKSISRMTNPNMYTIVFKRYKTGNIQYYGYDSLVLYKLENLYNQTSHELELLLSTDIPLL